METGNETFAVCTPEYVQLNYVLAGIGSRATAFFLDTGVRVVLLACILLSVFFLSEGLPHLISMEALSRLSKTWLLAIGILAYGVLDLGYFLIFEALWSGQTPGKRHQRLRVIKTDGQPVGWIESAIRNILRAMDMFLGVYPVGLVFMFLSKNNQRLGDHAAGTVVVMEGPASAPKQALMESETRMYPEIELHVSGLTAEQYLILKSFLQRREEMDPTHRRHLAELLIRQAKEQMGTGDRAHGYDESFLEEVVTVYEQKKRAI